MVGIEIPDGDPLRSAGSGGDRSECDLVQVAEAHRLPGGGVVTRRTHEGKRLFVLHEREVHGAQRRADRAPRMIVDSLEVGRVPVEIRRDLQAPEVGGRVHRQQHVLGRDGRDAPFP